MNSDFIAKARAQCRVLLLASLAFACCTLATERASAEIKIGEAGGWEAYTHGSVGVFLTYAFGDGYPVPPIDPATGQPVSRTIIGGGGVGDGGKSRIPDKDAMGNDDLSSQGTMSQWRIRNGFSPNTFGFGVRKQVAPNLKLRAQFTIWGTIEPSTGAKVRLLDADFKEGFGQVEGDWGTVTLGRHQGLFSRGIVEMNFLYLHQYGVGSHGGRLDYAGPTAGLIGFGVLAAFFQPGFTYRSPKFGGLQINGGIYDPVVIPGSWEVSGEPRPEFEITWDMKSDSTFIKFFVNGAWQKIYLTGQSDDETALGLGYGGRLEFGPIHFGAGGHYGRGLGLGYALEGGPTSVGSITVAPGQKVFEFRTFDGFSAFAQYAPGKFDINAGFGISRVHLLDSDKTGPAAASNTVVKTQTGIAAGFVYHISDRLHWDIDVMHAMFRWYKGEKQDVTFLNTGLTLAW